MTCWDSFSRECTAGVVGAVVSLVLLIAVQTLLIRLTRHYYPAVRFFDLLVTGDDNRYSLSRFQVYVWTAVVIIAFGAMTFSRFRFADFPPNLLLLIGVNLASAVAATAITTAKAAPPPAAAGQGPNFFRDIFLESNAVVPSLDLPRTQMFAWTLISLVTYIVIFIRYFPPAEVLVNGVPKAPLMPDVPQGLVALMGLSNGAYLGVKAAK